MSRIHEALKKAAEERAAQLTTAVEAGVAEIAAEPKGPVTLEPEMVLPTHLPRVTGSGKQDAGFNYEELVKRCVHQGRAKEDLSGFARCARACTKLRQPAS